MGESCPGEFTQVGPKISCKYSKPAGTFSLKTNSSKIVESSICKQSHSSSNHSSTVTPTVNANNLNGDPCSKSEMIFANAKGPGRGSTNTKLTQESSSTKAKDAAAASYKESARVAGLAKQEAELKKLEAKLSRKEATLKQEIKNFETQKSAEISAKKAEVIANEERSRQIELGRQQEESALERQWQQVEGSYTRDQFFQKVLGWDFVDAEKQVGILTEDWEESQP